MGEFAGGGKMQREFYALCLVSQSKQHLLAKFTIKLEVVAPIV